MQKEEEAKAKLAAPKEDDVLEMNEDGTFDATTTTKAAAPAAIAASKPAVKADAWSLPEVPASVLEDAREQSEELKAKEDEEDKTPARMMSLIFFIYII